MTILYVTDADSGNLISIDTANPSGNLSVVDWNTGDTVTVDLSSPSGVVNAIDANTGDLIEIDFANITGSISIIDANTGDIVLVDFDNPLGLFYVRDESTGDLVQIDLSVDKFFKSGSLVFPGGGVSTYSISGTVYDADGTTAVASATVALGALTATSAANGTYTIADIPAGTSGSMTCTKAGYSWSSITIPETSEDLPAQNFVNAWWAAGGIAAGCVAAYQPKGAASLAASYLRVAGSGGNANLDPAVVGGVAPTWNATHGWRFDGMVSAAAYLLSGIIPDANTSAVIRFTQLDFKGTKQMFGEGGNNGFGLFPNLNNTQTGFKNGAVLNTSAIVSGTHTMAVCGKNVYLDGVSIGTIGAGVLSAAELVFGAKGSALGNHHRGDWHTAAFYNTVLSAPQVLAIHTAMANIAGSPTSYAINAETPLTTPTYDTSGQAMHPSVVDLGSGNTWNGKRYWMAMTPYPQGNDDYENPSILVSDDGTTWTEPVGITNPIVPFPGGSGYNADAELILGQDNKLYCFYMSTDGSTFNKSYVKSSTDGVTWSAATELFSVALAAFGSPAVIWDGSQYVMWHVDSTTNPNTLYRRTCATPDGTWSAPSACTVTLPTDYAKETWHLDIVLDNGTYYLFNDLTDNNLNGVNTILWLFRSPDGLIFTPDAGYLLIPTTRGSGSAWDGARIYRSTAVKTAAGFDLWYSAVSNVGAWRTGRTAVTLS
jgi:hypothetical protein